MTEKTPRWVHILGVLGLTLFFVAGSAWLIRVSRSGAVSAAAPPALEAAAPAAPDAVLTLPMPWLSNDDVVDAPFNRPPLVDGFIGPGEYAGAGKFTFPGYGGAVEVFVKQDTITLYVAFDSPDTTPYPFPSGGGIGPAFQLFLDTDNSKDSSPQPGDYRLTLDKGSILMENQGDGIGGWGGPATGNWNAAASPTPWGWQGEFAIAFSKLGITQTGPLTIGLGVAEVWTPSWPRDWYWPSGGNWLNPGSWGYLVSSSDWGSFYWKPGPWEDYAPSGLPDFDQRRPMWSMGPISTHCGPVAMANSLWWFDSKFETPDHPPPPYSDTYRLVRSYTDLDDHVPQNVMPLVDDLASYFNTNGAGPGTYVTDMHSGTLAYLRDRGLWDDYLVTLVVSPTFAWVAAEVQRSEDVILLLGFYEWVPADSRWARVGGHYVSVAGVDPMGLIAFSDPFLDATEMGFSPGRVLSGTLVPHYPPHPGPDPYVHDDAGNVSHDIYPAVPTNSPGGLWGPDMYLLAVEPWPFLGANPHPYIPTEPWMSGFIQAEVEFALTVSPYTWKASGEWLPAADPVWGVWQPWQDYAPSGVPDIDQRQDGWQGPFVGGWTYCGPVAAANSLWWFDSKFEPNPVPPFIGINDNYPLVWAYGPWDDHDPPNVDSGAPPPPPPPLAPPPWPPGSGIGELVDELAAYFDTDGHMSGILHSGTIITDVYWGLDAYLWDRVDPVNPSPPLRVGYAITLVNQPDFWWVAEEIERSEDVILLLGFWQEQPVGSENWVRLGGHYLTLPGVDKQGGLLAFSDPYYDGAGFAWPYAYPGGRPSVMGRVADGWLIPHLPSHPPQDHNDAGNVSHDVYYVIPTGSPGGTWGPGKYVEGGWPSVEPFWGQNGLDEEPPPPTDDPIYAEVEWVVAVSPVADVTVNKDLLFPGPQIVPGDQVTFTIFFGNAGSLPAEEVVIADPIPVGLTNASVVGYWTSYGGTITTHDTFTWSVGTLAWANWGVITITAQLDPAYVWGAETIITNTVRITTTSQEQYDPLIEPLPNESSLALTVWQADVEIIKSSQPPTLTAGGWLTYTLVYSNNGPATAVNTVITDELHGWLTNATYTYTNNYGASVTDSDAYVWQVGSVPAGGWGTITVTAQVSPSLSGGGTLPNDAAIAAGTPEHDATNNDSSASNEVIFYGLELQPDSGGTVENPGQSVTYTLTLYNDGNVSDSFDVSGIVAGQAWTTTWPTAPIGPVGAGGDTQFDVTVEIPGSAGEGDWSRVTITATSQGDGDEWDTSVFTTTATTQVITRGVEIAPPAAAQTGDAGTTVTYTLYVTNSGSVADTVVLTVTGQTWTTTLSDYALSLDSGVGATVYAYVQVPSSGVGDGDQDTATVTASSAADPSQTASSVLTTTAFVPTYGLELQPDSGGTVENPGQSVTYTLTLYNDGNVSDSFDVSGIVAGQAWTTTWPTAPVGPVGAGGDTQFDVTVEIPGSASEGDWSRVTITATSQGDGDEWDASVFTTTATTQVITRGVTITAPVSAQRGDAGTTVTYTLYVTNSGSVADVIWLSLDTTHAWTTTLSAGSLSLDSEEGTTLYAYVMVPSDAASGDDDDVTVSATSSNDATASDDVTLTTTAGREILIYMPVMLKNYP